MIWKEDWKNTIRVIILQLNTFNKRPVILKYYQRFDYIDHAIAFEKQLKGWSRKKKEALFEENWEEIKRLSNLKKK